jgi:hypothetical protein
MVEGWKAWAAMEVEEESERLRGWWRERERERKKKKKRECRQQSIQVCVR